jgi:hypothetical protein
MTEQDAIEVFEKMKIVDEELGLRVEGRTEAYNLAIQALNTRQIQNNIVDSLVKKTKGMDTNSYEYRKIQYAINLIERCEVDHD